MRIGVAGFGEANAALTYPSGTSSPLSVHPSLGILPHQMILQLHGNKLVLLSGKRTGSLPMFFGEGWNDRASIGNSGRIRRDGNNGMERNEARIRRRRTTRRRTGTMTFAFDRNRGIAQARARTRRRCNDGFWRRWERLTSNRRKDVVWRTMAESIMHQPEPMVGNSLNFVEVVPCQDSGF